MARYYNTRRWGMSIRLIAMGLVLCLFVFAIDSQLRPVVLEMETAEAKNYATLAVYQAINDALAEEKIDYGYFVKLTKDENERVTSIETNVRNVGRLHNMVAMAVTEELQKAEYRELEIPLGTLTGIEFLAARGPKIPLRIAPYGYADVEITNEFTSAGINQTLHRINLSVQVRITAIIPGFPVRSELSTSMVLAETVIVGEVPEFYAGLSAERSGIELGALYDLLAEKNI